MSKNEVVILSSPLILENAIIQRSNITLEKAREILDNAQNVKVFSGHETVKVLGLEPTKNRDNCTSYETAIVVTPLERLEWGKEYTLDEILTIGVEIVLLEKVSEYTLLEKAAMCLDCRDRLKIYQ